MNMQDVATKKLAQLGYLCDFTLKGTDVEIMAFAGAHEETFEGQLSEVAAWVGKLPDMSAPVQPEEEWNELYGPGKMEDEDVQAALEAEKKLEEHRAKDAAEPIPPTQEEEVVAEAPAVTETPIEVSDVSNENVPEEGNMSVKEILFGKKDAPVAGPAIQIAGGGAPPVVVAAPGISAIQVVPPVSEVELNASLAAGTVNCRQLELDYQDLRGKCTFNRRIRVASVTETKVYAYDLAVYGQMFAQLSVEAPAGQAPEVVAAKAALAAKRTFLKDKVTGIRIMADEVSPLNPGLPGTLVIRPITDEAADQYGGLPRGITPASAPGYLEKGFELVPVGQ